jgi:hypothetical protein
MGYGEARRDYRPRFSYHNLMTGDHRPCIDVFADRRSALSSSTTIFGSSASVRYRCHNELESARLTLWLLRQHRLGNIDISTVESRSTVNPVAL